MPFATGAELDDALDRVRSASAEAMLVFPDGVTMVHRAKIADFAKGEPPRLDVRLARVL